MKNDTEPQRLVKPTAGTGILFELCCCSLSSNSCSCTQMEKHLVRKQQISVFQDRIRLPQLLRLHWSRFYFFLALTFLHTQFMPSLEGNGQREAVSCRKGKRDPAWDGGGWCLGSSLSDQLLQLLCGPQGSTCLTRDKGLMWGDAQPGLNLQPLLAFSVGALLSGVMLGKQRPSAAPACVRHT